MASAAKYKKNSRRSSAPAQLSVPKFLVGAALGTAIAWLTLQANFTTGVVALIGMGMAATLATLALRGRGKWRLSNAQTMAAAVFGVAGLAGAQAIGLSWADDCRPEPKIVKAVQNISQGGILAPLSDANNPSSAVKAKPGDILRYVITVSNVAPERGDNRNNVTSASITDTMPEGVERVDLPSSPRTFSDRMTDIIPRRGVIKTYDVKVTSNIDGQIQKNTVCLNSNGVHGNKPSRLCDVAYSRVVVPPAPPVAPAAVAPVPPPPAPIPEQPIQLPAELPQTGPGNYIVIGLMAIATGYLFSLLYAHMKNGKRGTGTTA